MLLYLPNIIIRESKFTVIPQFDIVVALDNFENSKKVPMNQSVCNIVL